MLGHFSSLNYVKRVCLALLGSGLADCLGVILLGDFLSLKRGLFVF